MAQPSRAIALAAIVAAGFVSACEGNAPPVAANDSAQVEPGETVLIAVLSNDRDPDGDRLSVAEVGEAQLGTVTIAGAAVAYTAPEGFEGTDAFNYVASDGRGGQDTAAVTVTVGRPEGENHPPVAANDEAEGVEGEVIETGDVLANDYDEDGDALHVASHTEPTRGTVVDGGDGTFAYTPPPDWNGVDSFSYVVSDGRGGTSDGVVTITVAPLGIDLYVAADGDDAAEGTIEAPLATLEGARDRVRARRETEGDPAGGFVVWLREGVYERDASFELTAEDSGTATSPLVFAAFPGEVVRLVGAIRLDPEAFAPVTAEGAPALWARLDPAAQGHLLALDLAGVTDDFGELSPRGFGTWTGGPAPLELFVDGERMQLARWPDAAEAFPWSEVSTALSDQAFTYEGDRPSRWLEAEDVWLHGYWMHMWADRHVRVESIDPASRTIALVEVPGYGVAAGQPFYAENLLEEVTVPGEQYLDRATGTLYLYPPGDLAPETEVFASILDDPIVSVRGASHVTLRGLTIEMGRGTLVDVTDGESVRVERCHLRNAGRGGAHVSGVQSGLERCEVHDTGDGGVVLEGGDRLSLTRAANYVRSCHIYRFGRWSWTYTPAVSVSGVGSFVSHNHMHDAPHSAVLFGGNEHFVEYNDIHDVCLWASDAGAIYSGRDWGFRGNRVQYNFVHDVDSLFEGYGVHGIYLDDCVSGVTVFGNIVYGVSGHAIQHGGGRDVVMTNNVLSRCGDGLRADSRGVTHIVHDGSSWDLLQKIVDVGYQDEPWASTYPDLARIPSSWAEVSDPGARWLYPEGSVFSRNLGFANGELMGASDSGPLATFETYAEIADNLEDVDPLFTDEESRDMTLAADSPAYDIPGFVAIPFDQIGIEPE